MRIKLGDCSGIVLTPEDYKEIKERIEEWCKEYPWLKKPALKSLLKTTLTLKQRIDNLEVWMDDTKNAEYRQSAIFLYDKLLGRFRMFMSSLGLAYTAQAHIRSSERRKGTSPEDILTEKEALENAARSETLPQA